MTLAYDFFGFLLYDLQCVIMILLWSSHHLVSQIIVNVDIGIQFFFVIYSMVFSVCRIIPSYSYYLISQVSNVGTDIPFYLIFILLFAVCWGSYLRALTILHISQISNVDVGTDIPFYLLFFYGFQIIFIISLAKYCWHWHNVLLVIYSMVSRAPSSSH